MSAEPKDLGASSTKAPGAKTAVALLRRFWAFARPHRRWVMLGVLMIPLVAALTTLRPLLLRHAVDVNIPAGDTLGLRLTGMAFLGAVVAEFLCQAAQVYTLQRAGHGTISDVRRTVFEHVLRLPSRFFDRHALGSLLTRTTSDVEAVSETLSFGVFTILTDIVMIGAILTAMFVLDAWLAAIALALAPVLVLLVRTFGRALRRLQLEVRKARASQDGYLAEQLTGITVVQLFHREDAAHREYERRGQRYLRATKWANVYDALLFSVMDGIAAFSIALMIWFAAPSVLTRGGVLTLGLLFAFIDYLQRIFEPIKQFSGKLATIQRAAASLERIYGLLDEPTEERSPPAPEASEGRASSDPLEGWTGGVRMRNVSFAYKKGGPDVLRDVSLDIAPGEVVAVVGRTGSGKTTLGRLITRVYEGYRGTIELDLPGGNRDLGSITPDALRRHALLVQQDVFLFSDDVRFNISLGEPGLHEDSERLRHALSVVQADRLLRRRGGLEFEVGERGGNLSAGEAQLVAFARVAARQPTLLVLDEATANVDSLTEQKVQAAIEQLLQGRSVLVIAHRLSTVRRADKIIVMKEGRIVEQGTHDELIAMSGVYAELYRMGFDDSDDSVDSTSTSRVPENA